MILYEGRYNNYLLVVDYYAISFVLTLDAMFAIHDFHYRFISRLEVRYRKFSPNVVSVHLSCPALSWMTILTDHSKVLGGHQNLSKRKPLPTFARMALQLLTLLNGLETETTIS